MSESFRKHIKKQHFPAHPSSIKFWTQFRNCIHEALKKRDWKEADSDGDWDLCWVEKETVQDLFGHLTAGQRINHFRNHYEITRKDLLIKNLKRHKKALEKEGKLDEAASYNFFPITYNLPNEYTIFSDEFKKANHNIWIMKPIGKSQGKGIFLFKKLSQISDWKLKEDNSQVENYIVQRYIHNPLLIGGKKFDLRIYCLVTSYSPLTAYLYRDGFARFTHHRYDNTDISNSYVHLTNVAIQKHSENYDKKLGGKWDLRTLKLYLTSKYSHEAVNLCFASIQQVIIKTLLSVQKVIIQDKHCFELYGFDILIDANLKPWVLEVNGSPSMTANTNQDNELKCGLLDDVFTVIDMEKILTGQEEQIGGFDLICKGEPITNNGTDINLSMLGCHNNRIQQIRSLAKVISLRLAQIHQRKKELNGETKKLKDKDKEKEKDTVHPLPIALSTDTLANARKNRSKSTGKGGSIGSQTGMPAVKIPPVRTSFNPKVVLAPLSQDGRENREIKENREVREGRALVQKQQPVRLYKGKTVDLPPVSNPNPNNVSVQNLVLKLNQAPAPVIVSNNQSIVTQNLLSNSGILVKNTNSIVANSGISRSYSNLNQSEISLKQHIQSKIATQTHISNLNNSSANLIIMGSSPPQEKGLKSEQRDFSPLQVTRILKPHKAQSDKNLLSAQWHPAEAYNYSIEKTGLGNHTTRRDSKHNIKDVYTPEGSTKSFTNTGKPTSKSEFPSHTNLYLSNNEPSASKYGGGTSHRDSRLNSE